MRSLWIRVKVLGGLCSFWSLQGRVCFHAFLSSRYCGHIILPWLLPLISKSVIQDPSFSPSLSCGLSAIRILCLATLDPAGQFRTTESQLISNSNSSCNLNASLLCNTAYSHALQDTTYLAFMLICRKKGCSSVMLIVKINAKRVVLLHLSHILGLCTY